jgi:hypothetical protein
MNECTLSLKLLVSDQLEELADVLDKEEKPSAVRKIRQFIEYLDGGKVEPV